MTQCAQLVSCHDCGLLQRIVHMPDQGEVICCRCLAVLRERQRIEPVKSIEHTLALVVTGLVLFGIANVFPIVEIQAAGQTVTATLLAGSTHLFNQNLKILAGLVFFTSFGAPLLQLTGLCYLLLPMYFNHIPWQAIPVFRFIRLVSTWNMLEVLVLGILVSVVKLSAMAAVIPGIALWAFGFLIFIIAAIISTLDNEMLWERMKPATQPLIIRRLLSNLEYRNCQNCNFLNALPNVPKSVPILCLRCGSPVHKRKPDSLNRCTAYLLAAAVLYIPANVFPVMVITHFGRTEGDTILSGVIYLATSGDWPLALIVFVASILVPCIKLIILSGLLLSVHFKSRWRPQERTRLYRLTELIGRWSMVDIYVATLMAALIQIQGLMEIEVGIGAFAFGAVVVLTMLSAMAFDPRLIWDNLEDVDGRVIG